jgi:hypothetical protein
VEERRGERRGEEEELKERATTSDQREGENNAREGAYEECSFIVQYERLLLTADARSKLRQLKSLQI